MQMPKILSCTALAILAAPASGALGSAPALPPASVGNSFVSLYSEYHGLGASQLLYLGSDGTCKQLSLGYLEGEGLAPVYQPSQTGTYTYVPTAGTPYEATLNINTAAGSTAYVLEFTGDNSGFLSAPGLGGFPVIGSSSFSFLPATPNTFLTNVSNRVTLRPADTAVTGFVIQGTASRLVLIRTVGPTLAQFGVSPVSANPAMNLYSGTGTDLIASGQHWGSVTGYDAQSMGWIFGIAGAFPLESGSDDVAYFAVLKPGIYTVQSSDATTTSSGASALTEVYILPYSG
jgi:hypothetical protein